MCTTALTQVNQFTILLAMERKIARKRKPIPINVDLHHRLDLFATSQKRTIREVTEEALAIYLAEQQRRLRPRPKHVDSPPAASLAGGAER